MSYIDRNLLPNERILFRTKKHLIIFFYPLVVAIVAVYAGAYFHANPLLNKLEWLPGGLALFLWAYTAMEYLFSEYVVTDKRIMMREGFFIRHTTEMRVNTISQVNVDQSLLGQVLNYGMITLQAFGAYDAYSTISCPGEFQRCVNEQANKT